MDRHIINDDDLHASLPTPLRFGAKLDQYNSASVQAEDSSRSGESPSCLPCAGAAAAHPLNVDDCGQPKIEGSVYCRDCHRRCHSRASYALNTVRRAA